MSFCQLFRLYMEWSMFSEQGCRVALYMASFILQYLRMSAASLHPTLDEDTELLLLRELLMQTQTNLWSHISIMITTLLYWVQMVTELFAFLRMTKGWSCQHKLHTSCLRQIYSNTGSLRLEYYQMIPNQRCVIRSSWTYMAIILEMKGSSFNLSLESLL